jgi:hypothetical protein
MKVKINIHHSLIVTLLFLLIVNQIYGQPNETKANNIYLIIASEVYFNSNTLDTFITFREQDFTVQVVKGANIGTTKDDYRDYIRSLMPDYVLLVGKYGDFPVHTVPYPKEVESYNYYVASSTIGHPNQDIPLGLFFAENNTELENIINKTISFENNFTSYPKEYYGHAGSNAALPPWPVEFNEEILTEMQTRYFGPESYNFTLANANDTNPNDVWTDINMINTGIRFMIYHGHGNINKWSFGLGTGGLPQLTNTIYPIILSFACLTGTFSGSVDTSSFDCFAQKITTIEHGAVAFFGAYNTASKGMNQLLEGSINGLFNDTITPRLGDALLYAYANTNNTNTVNTYYPTVTAVERKRTAWQFHLFGDPALKILDDITSVKEIAQNNHKIIVYPNPTSGIVSIDSDKEIIELIVFSTNGEILVYSTNTSKVDISSLPKGVYFISLKMKNETVYRKIIRM